MPQKLVQVFILAAFITHIFSATYTDSDVLQPPFCETSQSIALASDPGDGELHDGMENVLEDYYNNMRPQHFQCCLN